MDWSFELNGLPMSELKRQSFSVPAFSGLGSQANKKAIRMHSGIWTNPTRNLLHF